MDLYREKILDHYKHPRNFGHLTKKTATSSLMNTACGDKITMEVLLGEKNGKQFIEDIRFSGVGCAISQASASLLTEKVKGLPVKEILQLNLQDLLKLLETTLTPSRTKCATLPLEVLQTALMGISIVLP